MVPAGNPKNDSDEFTILLEHLFRQGLMQKSIPFHSVAGGVTDGSLPFIRVVLYSRADLVDLDRFLKSQFLVNEDHSVPVVIPRCSSLSPATYTASLRPPRAKLPEWEGFEDRLFLIEANSILGEAFQGVLSVLSHDSRPETADISESEKKRLLALAEELNEKFSMLYSRKHAGEKSLASANASGEPSLEEIEEDEVSEDVSPEKCLGQADVLLYFRTHPNILSRWSSIASESGLRLQEVGYFAEGGENSRGFRQFLNFLQENGLEDVHDVASFMEKNLGSWELLYEALETARVKHLLPSEELSLFEFALALLKAREQLS